MLLDKWFHKKNYSRGQIISHYKSIFLSESGKIVLADLCRVGYIDKSLFHPDSREEAYREGRRAMALHILNTISLDPSLYLQQLQEV